MSEARARRSIVYPEGAPVFVEADRHLVSAVIVEDDGFAHPRVRLEPTGDVIAVAARWLSLRRGPPGPPPGGGGRDVEPLRFPAQGLGGLVIPLNATLRRRDPKGW